MVAVIQRVSEASVEIRDSVENSVERIGRGIVILLGVAASDGAGEADMLAAKICGLRIFEDPEGKMNLSAADVGGELLIVSNFTLCADCRKGRRPSFAASARPEVAEPLYRRFVSACADAGLTVRTGVFGGDMRVSISNDGPVTLVLDTDDLK